MDGVAIVVRRHTDPIAAPEPDVRSLGPPIVRLARLGCPGGLDRLVRRHFREFSVAEISNSLVPGVDHGCESNQIVDVAAAILPRKPNRMVGRQIGGGRLVPEYELSAVGEGFGKPREM